MKTTQLGKYTLGALAVLVLATACGPRDVPAENSRGGSGGNSTAPLTLSQNGTRPNTCDAKKPDRTHMRSPMEKDTDVYSGKVTASLSVGNENCLRIGAVVNLQNGDKAPVRGQVTITKIEIMPVESISDAHAKFFNLPSGSDLRAIADKEIKDVIEKDIFKPNGMVSITYFTFNKGSQPAGIEVPPTVPTAQEIITLDKVGERAETCPASFTDAANVIVASDAGNKVLAQQITATMEAGDRNCFRIGSEVKLSIAKEAPAITKVKVTKVQIVPIDKLDKTHAQALGLEEATVKAAAQAKLDAVKFPHMDLVHITYFQIPGAEQPVTPVVPEVPVIDPAHYAHYLPRLKEVLSRQLTEALAQHQLEWDQATLTLEYAQAVTITSVPLNGETPVTSSFPAYRVSLKTLKGSSLVLFNHMEKAERLVVMDANVVNDDLTDVEGIVISSKTTWSSVAKDFAPLGFLLYNQTTGKMTQVYLSGPQFSPLAIDVTLK